MWLGVIHHVCGEHEWVDGSCSHGAIVDATEVDKNYLEKDSKAHNAIREIVMDKRWIKSLKYYIYFRYFFHYVYMSILPLLKLLQS